MSDIWSEHTSGKMGLEAQLRAVQRIEKLNHPNESTSWKQIERALGWNNRNFVSGELKIEYSLSSPEGHFPFVCFLDYTSWKFHGKTRGHIPVANENTFLTLIKRYDQCQYKEETNSQ